MRPTAMFTICKYYNKAAIVCGLCPAGPSVKSKVSALPPCLAEHLILKMYHNTTRRHSQNQRWPESLFKTPTPSLTKIFESGSGSGNFSNLRIRPLFRLQLTIDPTEICQYFCIRNDHADSCYCRNWNVKPDPGPLFYKVLTPGPKENRRILPESTPSLRFHGSGVPESTRAGFCVFLSDPNPE